MRARRLLCVTLFTTLPITGLSAQEQPVRVREIPVVAPAEVGMSAEQLAKVGVVMQTLVDESRLAGATVLVARKGKVCYFETFGMADREAAAPMKRDTIHRIYSMTKAPTCAAALILVDEGKLKLDDPVAKYVPEMAELVVYGEQAPTKPSRAVTVRDLMLHTTGFGYGRDGVAAVDERYGALRLGQRDLSLEEFSKRLAGIPAYFDPGTSWKYGVSIDVLGRVVEVASGQSFESFLQQRLFGPLDMRDTGFHVPAGKVDRLSANYNSNGAGTLTPIDRPATSRYLQRPKLASGGGGLVSTARDYLRFLEMVRNGGALFGTRVLSQESVRLMTTNQLSKEVGWIRFGGEERRGVGFGCGFSVRVEDSPWDPAGRIGEYGWGGAASTHYWVSPKDELTVITLEQTMPYSFLTEFAIKGVVYEAVE